MKWLMLLSALLPSASNATSQILSADAQLKAAFIYRFAQFTQWPEGKKDGLTYCILGDDDVLNAMQDLIDSSVMQVKAVNAKQNLTPCNVLYLAADASGIPELIQQLESKAILTIAENVQTFRQGMVIGFITEPKRLSFRVNLQVARQQQLTLSSQMLKLAKEVY